MLFGYFMFKEFKKKYEERRLNDSSVLLPPLYEIVIHPDN